jgi:hypothetical protein
MAAAWPVVAVAKSENRRELKLSKEVNEKLKKSGLDRNVYTLVGLNFLEISNTCLSELADELGNLTNLTNLVLQGNQLTTLPASLGNLSKLKYLDVSHNKLESLPSELTKLGNLHTLNALMNQLTDFPDVSTLTSLHILNISHNKLSALPEGISSDALVHLSEITANNNEIVELPSDLSNLPHLNILNLSNNKLQELPLDLCKCTKLKDLKLSGNKIKDRKLVKFTEQNSLKQIFTFLAAEQKKAAASGGDKKGKPKKKKKKGEKEVDELAKSLMTVLKFPAIDGLVVKAESKVADIRPYIVCCVIRDVNFYQSNNMFKNFITKQVSEQEKTMYLQSRLP